MFDSISYRRSHVRWLFDNSESIGEPNDKKRTQSPKGLVKIRRGALCCFIVNDKGQRMNLARQLFALLTISNQRHESASHLESCIYRQNCRLLDEYE